MKTVKTILVLSAAAAIALSSCRGQHNRQVSNTGDMEKEEVWESPDRDFEKMDSIANADYGRCYTIGKYMLCPERKLVRVRGMYGTPTIDASGFFPEPSLKYGGDTMIVFAGIAFFDRSGLDIDWRTVELLSYMKHYSEFTDGRSLYSIRYGEISGKGGYDKDTYTPHVEEKPAKRNSGGVRELTEAFYVRKDVFCFGYTPILEQFDVPELRTIVSESGFETDYITDGKQVVFGGGKTGSTITERDGKEYVVAAQWMVEGIDFASLRVLGKDMLADKNALYYGADVIPFAELGGFKFILREM